LGALLAILSTASAPAGETGTGARILVGVRSECPPYAFVDPDGEPRGFDVDLVRQIARESGLEVSFRVAKREELRAALISGAIDVCFGAEYALARLWPINLSRPYTVMRHVVYKWKGAPRLEDEGELYSKPLIVARGTVANLYAEERGFTQSLILADTEGEALRLLDQCRANYAIVGRYPGLYWTDILRLRNVKPTEVDLLPAGLCFAVRKSDAALMARLSDGLRRTKESGRYEALYRQWLESLEPRGIPTRTVLLWAGVALGIALFMLLAALIFWSRTLSIRVTQRTAELREEIGQRQQAQEKLLEAHRHLQQTEAQLVQSEKLAVIGQLAAGIAHEINNPLSYVSNNLHVLRRDFRAIADIFRLYSQAAAEGETETQQRLIMEAQAQSDAIDANRLISKLDNAFSWTLDGAERIRRIVVDMRSFARVGEAKWKEISIHDAIDTTFRIVAHALREKNITIEKHYGDLPFIACMPDRINQVLLNLVVNAIDAVPQDGWIGIETAADDSTARIAISDNGPGIPAENLTRIFDPFFTTKPKGTGLGLSISQSIIAEHGGQIDVESEEGKGATFIISLPVPSEKAEAEMPESSDSTASALR